MKRYCYFISVSFRRNDGSEGRGMGEHRLDKPVTTIEQLKAIAKSVEEVEPEIHGVTINSFQLLRVEEDPSQN